MTTRAMWTAAQTDLTEAEKQRIIQQAEESGEHFDTILLAYLRAGMQQPRFCHQCGAKLH